MKITKKIFQTKLNERVVDYSLLFFRVLVSSSLINTHGIKKVLHFQDEVKHLPDLLGIGGYATAIIAVGATVVAPILIILGLSTRLMALLSFCITFSGFAIVHAKDAWEVRDAPLMYSLSLMLIFVLGAGKYSLDALVSRKYFKNIL